MQATHVLHLCCICQGKLYLEQSCVLTIINHVIYYLVLKFTRQAFSFIAYRHKRILYAVLTCVYVAKRCLKPDRVMNARELEVGHYLI